MRSAKDRFREATDRLKGLGITLQDVAAEFDIRDNTVSRWRNESDRLIPRPGWEVVLAALAESASENLRAESDAARRLAAELRSQAKGAAAG